MKTKRWLVLASLLCLTPIARGEDVEKIFQTLFGDRLKEVAKTTTRQDDADLAKELLAAAKEAQEEAALLRVVCTHAYDLGSRHPDGYATALDAMRLLAEKDPASATEALKKAVLLQTRIFRYAKRELKEELGEALIDDHLALSAAEETAGNMPPALAQYSAAISVARSIRSNRLVKIQAGQKALVARKHIHDNIQMYLGKLKANPKDDTAAKQLVLLYVMELDEPEKARKYTFLLADPTLKTNVSLANKPLEDVLAPEAYTLAKWYKQMAGSVRTTLKPPLLVRSLGYFQRFLALHEAKDLKKTEAELTIKTIRKDLATFGPVASIAKSKSLRRTSRGSAIRYTGKPITLDVEKAGKILGDMKRYKDGDITYVSVKKRDGDRNDQTRTPSKGRVVILVQVPKATTVRLHGHINTPSRGDGNNSFFVAVVPGKQTDAKRFAHWEGPSREAWTWMPIRGTYQLAAGVNSIIIAAREEGAMLDKIRIAPAESD